MSELVPSSFEELMSMLDSFEKLSSEEISFSLGALLYLASRSAGLLWESKSPTERFSLFMRFASCVDPKLDPVRTLKNYSGKFLNYAMDKVRTEGSVPCLSQKSLERLTQVLRRELSSDHAKKVVIGMMGVRDVSYMYVYFHSDESLKKLFESSKEGFGCSSRESGGG